MTGDTGEPTAKTVPTPKPAPPPSAAKPSYSTPIERGQDPAELRKRGTNRDSG